MGKKSGLRQMSWQYSLFRNIDQDAVALIPTAKLTGGGKTHILNNGCLWQNWQQSRDTGSGCKCSLHQLPIPDRYSNNKIHKELQRSLPDARSPRFWENDPGGEDQRQVSRSKGVFCWWLFPTKRRVILLSPRSAVCSARHLPAEGKGCLWSWETCHHHWQHTFLQMGDGVLHSYGKPVLLHSDSGGAGHFLALQCWASLSKEQAPGPKGNIGEESEDVSESPASVLGMVSECAGLRAHAGTGWKIPCRVCAEHCRVCKICTWETTIPKVWWVEVLREWGAVQSQIQLIHCHQESTSNSKALLVFSFTLHADAVVSQSGFTSRNLHCTAYFAGSHSSEGDISSETLSYASRPAVHQAMGRAYKLSIIGFVMTPRTVGARVRLSRRQRKLWAQDDWEQPAGDETSFGRATPWQQVPRARGRSSHSHHSGGPYGNDGGGRRSGNATGGMWKGADYGKFNGTSAMDKGASCDEKHICDAAELPDISSLKIAGRTAAADEDKDIFDVEGYSRFHPLCGFGSRAHLTLRCSAGVQTVQTGLDLIEVVQCEAQSLDSSRHVAVRGAAIRYYGSGRCVVYLNKDIEVGALFSGQYWMPPAGNKDCTFPVTGEQLGWYCWFDAQWHRLCTWSLFL